MSVFPPVPLAEWADTEETLHRLPQIVVELPLLSACVAGARRAGWDLAALRCPTAPEYR